MERKIDSMLHRKSTHLAGVDVDIMAGEKGKCILTIRDAYYDTGVDVSGNKTDGYFLEFVEKVKGMVVNSGNRSRIAGMYMRANNSTPLESRNIGNWIGMTIELKFDPKVKMMGKPIGGIVVQPIAPVVEKEELTPDHVKWNGAKKSNATIETIRKHYNITNENYKLLCND